MDTCAVSETKAGKEGMIIPKPIESKQMVIKIKIKAVFDVCKLIWLFYFKINSGYRSNSCLISSIQENKKGPASARPFISAESEGFEPPVPLGTTVFKTAAIDHSANSPRQK